MIHTTFICCQVCYAQNEHMLCSSDDHKYDLCLVLTRICQNEDLLPLGSFSPEALRFVGDLLRRDPAAGEILAETHYNTKCKFNTF